MGLGVRVMGSKLYKARRFGEAGLPVMGNRHSPVEVGLATARTLAHRLRDFWQDVMIPSPSGDAAMKLLKFWREMEAATGHLKRSFQVESGDTRFLGDLYQELSERAKKKFALLQTPVFVEEFILGGTLTPALDEFGLEKVRMIDPTCGSGHFLLYAVDLLERIY